MPRRMEASGDPTAHASGARKATVSGAVRQRCTNHAAGQAEPDTSCRAGHVSTSAAEGSSDGPPPAPARATSSGRPSPPTTSDTDLEPRGVTLALSREGQPDAMMCLLGSS
jgi:hypothetical protein